MIYYDPRCSPCEPVSSCRIHWQRWAKPGRQIRQWETTDIIIISMIYLNNVLWIVMWFWKINNNNKNICVITTQISLSSSVNMKSCATKNKNSWKSLAVTPTFNFFFYEPNVQFSFFYEPNVQIDSLNFFKTKKIPFTVTRERQKITGGIREIILIARMYG